MSRPLYYFEWRDHWGSNEGGWLKGEDFKAEPLICISVGWIVKDDKHGLLICAALSPSNEIGHLSYLLKSCITKKRRIRV